MTSDLLIKALAPIISRVRTDRTAVKKNGKMYWTENEALTEGRLKQHLNGGPARGVCPIKEGESVTGLAMLDMDSHQGETTWMDMLQVAQAVLTELVLRGMKPILFRSSGGKGIHIFLLWDKLQDAYSVRQFLEEVISAVGYSNGTGGVAKRQIEIFPKQDHVPNGRCGSQFILPLAGQSVPLEPLLGLDPMPREYAAKLEWQSSPSVPLLERPAHPHKPESPAGYTADVSEIREMLSHIDPNIGYDPWMKIGMALHNKTDGSDEGLALFDEWSANGTLYKGFEEIQAKWNSFGGDRANPVTIKTIIQMARKGGWTGEVLSEFDDLSAHEGESSPKPILQAANHSGIACKIIEGQFCAHEGIATLRRIRGIWYEYQGACYRERDEEGIRAVVRKYLDLALKRDKDGLAKPFLPTPVQINAVIDALRAAVYAEKTNYPYWIGGHDSRNPNELLSLSNGLLHIPTRTLQPHTPNFFTLNSLPYAWEECGEPVEWLKFMAGTWPGDKESPQTLQEIFGYLLTPDTSQQKIFLIKGPPRSGKSTIGRILKALLGNANVCGPTLSGLSKNFGLQPLIDKLAAIVPDARISGQMNRQVIVEHLLMVSGEDTVTVDRKNIEAWTGTLTARFMMFSNETPQLGDASGALASRFIVLATHHSFYGKEDKGLDARLIKELPQILRWALDGKDRLKARGYFVQPSSASDVVDELSEINSPMLTFVGEMCEMGEKYEVEISRIFDAWRGWCSKNGREHYGTIQSFGKMLSAAAPLVKKRKLGGGEDRIPTYSGIRLKEAESELF